jgi:hypothetical protein
MKKFIIGAIIILASVVGCNTAKAQNVKREGKTFIAKSTRGASASKDVATTYTWKDTKGNEYPILLHQYTKGENEGKWTAYVMRVSSKTGKEYKYYIPNGVEIAEQIMRETGK